MTVNISISTTSDGSMKHGATEAQICANRQGFLQNNSYDPEVACLVRLEYAGDDYCRYREVDEQIGGEGIVKDSTIVADGLVTRVKKQALFLPLADCIGMVIWDQGETAIMVSHLGRHNLEQMGGAQSIKYFLSQTGIGVEDIRIFLSPAASSKAYPLYNLENKGLHEVATRQLLAAGVGRDHISIDDRDTASDQALYSHSEFLKGNREVDGRFMLVAALQ
ncbi:MAG TPA: laccase domain-containing protein [Candidatus Saccharimonadales bacterium]